MNKVKFDNTKQLLFIESSKNINISDILEFIERIGNNNTLPRRLSIIEDARNVDVSFNLKDMAKLISKLKETIPKYEMIFNAVVLNKPTITAYAILVGLEARSEKFHHEVFSTKEAAKEWLNRWCFN